MSARTTAAVAKKVVAHTVASMSSSALSQAAAWNDNEADLRNVSSLMAWRDSCRDEVRDVLEGSALNHSEREKLLAAWVTTFDGEVYGVSDAADDIECAIETANDLLRLALDRLPGVADSGANAAIRGAKRFIDDIGAIARQLHATGGAANSTPNNIGVDRNGWMPVATGATPDSNRDVLVWNTAEQQPTAAFYCTDENCWFSKYDGLRLGNDVVTHWQEIQAPEGVTK
ncbi:hypothetical protein [Rugamonas apoptosis]|uniref:DUF551 domain-containing protein n=1 Tax=Rugamonas apoptosis TaxID=2758570 RepID=A0A7W2F8D1_9BURK|nr:hypothetical protein [Rugamonas apoptosis]MBA5686961.1 hypothetical protein [Rugamonas apoptosis]